MSNLARTVALLLVALCAGAQAAVVGIYFDENATCAAGIVQRYTAAPAYLIFSSMPSSTINSIQNKLSSASSSTKPSFARMTLVEYARHAAR